MRKYLFLFIGLIISSLSISQLAAQDTFQNPILPGFNPDPSVCRVGDDYYLVTSSWEYFPSIPIYHSKDLVNWEIVNYVATRPDQIDLTGFESYGGIWAPTIRHNNGEFFVTVSLVKRKTEGLGILSVQNILFTTEDVLGEWSAPNVLTNSTASGIDPALFFDDNGKVFLLLNRTPEDESLKDSRTKVREICIQEFDLESRKLVGEIYPLTRGFSATPRYAEGPRLIKKDGFYYLLISEGGTGFMHAVTISRSRKIFGPFEQYDGNPILSHRHLGEDYPFQYIGHADFVKTQNDEWWAVVLGIRLTTQGNRSIMGRETFLCPMEWEDKRWPVMSPKTGTVPFKAKRPNLESAEMISNDNTDYFTEDKLSHKWNCLRTHYEPFYTVDHGLNLKTLPQKITEPLAPAFIGQRITASSFISETALHFRAKGKEEAGIVIISSNHENYRFIINKESVQLIGHHDADSIYASQSISKGNTHYLRVVSDAEYFSFYYSNDNENWESIFENATPNVLGFRHTTGDYIGMYTSSNGTKSKNTALFDWFKYAPQVDDGLLFTQIKETLE